MFFGRRWCRQWHHVDFQTSHYRQAPRGTPGWCMWNPSADSRYRWWHWREDRIHTSPSAACTPSNCGCLSVAFSAWPRIGRSLTVLHAEKTLHLYLGRNKAAGEYKSTHLLLDQGNTWRCDGRSGESPSRNDPMNRLRSSLNNPHRQRADS